jgi:hypothetical protein
MTGLCGLVVNLVSVVVGKFLTCRDILDRYNPDGVAKLFRVAVGLARVIDIACCVLGRISVDGIPLIQAKDIDIACG